MTLDATWNWIFQERQDHPPRVLQTADQLIALAATIAKHGETNPSPHLTATTDTAAAATTEIMSYQSLEGKLLGGRSSSESSSDYSQAKAGKEVQPKPVRGRIVDSEDRPVSGATIEFQTSSRKTITAKSDNDGNFQLPLKKADEAPRLLLASNADGTAQAYLSSEELVKRGATLGDIQLAPARKLDFLVAVQAVLGTV